MTARTPSGDLAALLDALEAEVLAATDEDLRAALAEAGRLGEAALRQVSQLLAADPGEAEHQSAIDPRGLPINGATPPPRFPAD
jgi:hypothetical protein